MICCWSEGKGEAAKGWLCTQVRLRPKRGHRRPGEVVDTGRCGSGTEKGTRERDEKQKEPGRARLGGEF